MKKSMARFSLFAAVVVMGVGGLAAPASAAYSGCNSGRFCLYEHPNGGGKVFNLATEDSTFHNNPCDGCISSHHPNSDGTWGDMASSYYNHSSRTYCVYRDTNYIDELFRLAPNSRGNFGDLEDEVSSARPC